MMPASCLADVFWGGGYVICGGPGIARRTGIARSPWPAGTAGRRRTRFAEMNDAWKSIRQEVFPFIRNGEAAIAAYFCIDVCRGVITAQCFAVPFSQSGFLFRLLIRRTVLAARFGRDLLEPESGVPVRNVSLVNRLCEQGSTFTAMLSIGHIAVFFPYFFNHSCKNHLDMKILV